MTYELEGTVSLVPDGIRGDAVTLSYQNPDGGNEQVTLPITSEERAYLGLTGGETMKIEVTSLRDGRLQEGDIVNGSMEITKHPALELQA